MATLPTARPRDPARPRWALIPAAVGLLAGGAFAVHWAGREPPPAPRPPGGPMVGATRYDEPPPAQGDRVYAVAEAVEHGVRVLKIRVTPGGDELVVDARTGRLIEARPPRPATGAAPTPTALAP